jgi:hypothetical protein
MSVQIYEVATSSGDTASGYFAFNTLNIRDGLLKHVFVDFGNTVTQFELKLIDNKNRQIIYLNSCNTVVNRNYDLPVRGIYTMAISNATIDTQCKIRMAVQDVF